MTKALLIPKRVDRKKLIEVIESIFTDPKRKVAIKNDLKNVIWVVSIEGDDSARKDHLNKLKEEYLKKLKESLITYLTITEWKEFNFPKKYTNLPDAYIVELREEEGFHQLYDIIDLIYPYLEKYGILILSNRRLDYPEMIPEAVQSHWKPFYDTLLIKSVNARKICIFFLLCIKCAWIFTDGYNLMSMY